MFQLPNHQNFVIRLYSIYHNHRQWYWLCFVHHEKNCPLLKSVSIVLYLTIVEQLYKPLFDDWVIFFLFNHHFPIFVILDFLLKEISYLHCIMFALETLHEQESFLFVYTYCYWVLFILKKMTDWSPNTLWNTNEALI